MHISDTLTLKIDRIIDAPRSVVWLCWTVPSIFKQWFCPRPWKVTEAKFELRPGGKMHTVMEGPDDSKESSLGIWLEVIPRTRLVFTDAYTEGFIPAAESFMTGFVELADQEHEKTKMTWGARHRTVGDVNRHLEMGFEVGWNTAVDQLNELAHRIWTKQGSEGVESQLISSATDSVRTCLWFESRGEEAANFYVSLLPNSHLVRVNRPDPKHEALAVDFTLNGVPYQILNGGPHYQLSPAASISVLTETQEETDRLWEALTQNGGRELMCGWLTDQFGLSWQIIPRILLTLLNSTVAKKRERAHASMMQMTKIDIERLVMENCA